MIGENWNEKWEGARRRKKKKKRRKELPDL
jgi:hypothetical protein